MDLLLFFAIPVATILLSIVWQRIIKSPILVAITSFAISILFVYSVDPSLLIFAIAYTALSFISAVITKIIFYQIESKDLSNFQLDSIETNTLNATNLNIENNNSNISPCRYYNKKY